MRIWPVVIDSQPSYLHGEGRSASLLLAPLGQDVLIERLARALTRITSNPPLVLASPGAVTDYTEWIKGACPNAHVIRTPHEFAEALAGHELSDVLLFVDPRCLPTQRRSFSHLVRHHILEPRVSHHLVAFERPTAGTQERISFNASGHIRGIRRYYEPTTWPFVAGVAASLVPSACFDVADGQIPASLTELRQLLISRGVPGRDVPIDGGSVDLANEHGMLAENERLAVEMISDRASAGGTSTPICIGTGQAIHPTARLVGPVVLHADVCIEAGARVMGPAVIGAGATISSGATIAHAAVGPDSVVPSQAVVRGRAWFDAAAARVREPEVPMPYGERLARLSMEGDERASIERREYGSGPESFPAKRALDICAAAAGLMLLSPVFAAIAAAIRLESKGPIFYGDDRETSGGRVFKCWKFRTMYTGAHLAQRDLDALNHADGPHFKIARDPRVTRTGRILRALNLDEVPQLFNVFVGEMSLVGPRPSPFRENQVCVPWRDARLSVRPGITGLWQVCRHDRSNGDFHQWIEYDLLYVQHQSMWLDLKILAATLLTFGGKVAYVSPSRLVAPSPVMRAPAPRTPAQQRHDEAEQVA